MVEEAAEVVALGQEAVEADLRPALARLLLGHILSSLVLLALDIRAVEASIAFVAAKVLDSLPRLAVAVAVHSWALVEAAMDKHQIAAAAAGVGRVVIQPLEPV
jgi:hypothetical protein